MDSLVPSGTFEVHTEAENTILWLLGNFLWINLIVDLEVHVKLINSDDMLSGEVLSSTCEEGLWEEESGEPVSWWVGVCDPF